MLAEIGIPQGSLMRATFAPTAVYNENGLPTAYVNTNLVATSPAMAAAYVSDAIVGSVWEYSMTIDVRSLSSANGNTVAGRTATIRAAKLALLAMARNLSDLSDGSYRLTVAYTGLPSQTGVPGTRLNATTRYPYSAASPLLAAYESELIDVGGSCP